MTARDLPPLELAGYFTINDEGSYAQIECDDGQQVFTASMEMDRVTALRDWLTGWIEARQPPMRYAQTGKRGRPRIISERPWQRHKISRSQWYRSLQQIRQEDEPDRAPWDPMLEPSARK